MNAFRQAMKSALSAMLPPHLLLTQGPRDASGIALTFDDGPHPKHTPPLLDALQVHGIHATFFVVGREAEWYPEIVRRIVADGHEIGGHTYTHSDPARTSARKLRDELRRSRDLLEGITGRPLRLFRPPFGKMSALKFWEAWRAHQTVVLWNADPRDFAMTSPNDVARWCQNYVPQNGDVLLFHDNHPHAVRAVPLVGESAARQNLTFRRISDWISASRKQDAVTVSA